MSIDELLRDAMSDEVSTAPTASDDTWMAIGSRSAALRRSNRRRRVTVIGVGVAATVLAGVIIISLASRSTSDDNNLFVGEPTTTASGPATGPTPAADVTPALAPPAQGGAASTPVSWLIARTGSTDRELVLSILRSEEGGCGTDYAAAVDDRADGVTVTLFAEPKEPPPASSCPAIAITRQRAVKVELPSPLGDRRLFDGARADSSGIAPVDGHTLLVPALPADMSAQTEFLSDTWSVCYASDAVLCSQLDIAGPTVSTIQTESATAMIAALSLPVTPTADPIANEDPVDWLRRSWPATAATTYRSVEIDGRPALIFDREPIDRFGSTVIVWADRSTLEPGTSWIAVGISAQMGLTDTQLVALAEAMHTVG